MDFCPAVLVFKFQESGLEISETSGPLQLLLCCVILDYVIVYYTIYCIILFILHGEGDGTTLGLNMMIMMIIIVIIILILTFNRDGRHV